MKKIHLIINSITEEVDLEPIEGLNQVKNLDATGSQRFFLDAMISVAMFLNGHQQTLGIVSKDVERMAELACILKSITSLKHDEEFQYFIEAYAMFPTKDYKFELEMIRYKSNGEKEEVSLYKYAYIDEYSPFDFSMEASNIMIMLHDAIHQTGKQLFSDLPTVKGLKYYSRENWRNEYTLVHAFPLRGGCAMVLSDVSDPKNNTVVVESCEFTGNPCPSRLHDSEFYVNREKAIDGAIKKKKESYEYLESRRNDLINELK